MPDGWLSYDIQKSVKDKHNANKRTHQHTQYIHQTKRQLINIVTSETLKIKKSIHTNEMIYYVKMAY